MFPQIPDMLSLARQRYRPPINEIKEDEISDKRKIITLKFSTRTKEYEFRFKSSKPPEIQENSSTGELEMTDPYPIIKFNNTYYFQDVDQAIDAGQFWYSVKDNGGVTTLLDLDDDYNGEVYKTIFKKIDITTLSRDQNIPVAVVNQILRPNLILDKITVRIIIDDDDDEQKEAVYALDRQDSQYGNLLKKAEERTNQRLDQLWSSSSSSTQFFLQKLKTLGAVIAGSFVMQTVLDEVWSDGDIDIWVPHIKRNSEDWCDAENIEPAAYCALRTFLESKDYKRKPFIWTNAVFETKNTEYEFYQRMACVQRITFFTDTTGKKRPDIQIIELQRPQIYNSCDSVMKVISSFDITACHAAFMPDRGVLMRTREDLEDLLSRRLRFSEEALEKQTLREWFRTGKRILKYKERGFRMVSGEWEKKLVPHIRQTAISILENRPFAERLKIDLYFLAYRFGSLRSSTGKYRLPRLLCILNIQRPFCALYDDEEEEPSRRAIPILPSGVNLESDTDRTLLFELSLQDKTAETDSTKTCRSIEELEDWDIEKYKKEEPLENIVFLELGEQNSTCFTKQKLFAALHDRTLHFYECSPVTGKTILTQLYVNLGLSNMSYLVSLESLQEVIFSDFQVYTFAAERKLERTMGRSTLENNNYVSGNHCQVGSDRMLYKIVIVK